MTQYNAATTMPELQAEVARLTTMVAYYRAENHHVTPESGRVLASLLTMATTDTMEDLNGWYDMSHTATCLLNDYLDQLKVARSEIVSLCPSLEVK
jgi:hypothetical protein